MCSKKKTIPLSNTIPPKMSLCLQNQMVSEWLRPFLQNSSTNLTQDTSGNRAQLCVYKSNCIPSPEPTIWSLSSQLQHHVVYFFSSRGLSKHVLMFLENLYLLYFILRLNDPQCPLTGQTRKKRRWNLPRPQGEYGNQDQFSLPVVNLTAFVIGELAESFYRRSAGIKDIPQCLASSDSGLSPKETRQLRVLQ